MISRFGEIIDKIILVVSYYLSADTDRRKVRGAASSAVDQEAVDALADVAEVGFVAGLELSDDAAGVADVSKGGPHSGPVDVSVAEVDPGVAIVLALEIFEMNFHDAFAESANPVLRITVKNHIADIEPRLDPRAFKFANV